jgi:hypothetical protein
MRRGPDVGQQIRKLRLAAGQPLHHVPQLCPHIQVMTGRAADDCVERRRMRTGAGPTQERPGLNPNTV